MPRRAASRWRKEGRKEVNDPAVFTNSLLWKMDENGPFLDDLPIKIVIFHSDVSLPEGT